MPVQKLRQINWTEAQVVSIYGIWIVKTSRCPNEFDSGLPLIIWRLLNKLRMERSIEWVMRIGVQFIGSCEVSGWRAGLAGNTTTVVHDEAFTALTKSSSFNKLVIMDFEIRHTVAGLLHHRVVVIFFETHIFWFWWVSKLIFLALTSELNSCRNYRRFSSTKSYLQFCNGWAKCKYKVLSSQLRLVTVDRYVFKSPPLRKHKRWWQCGRTKKWTPKKRLTIF